MTELVLILGINLAGLTFAIGVARWMVLREAVSAEVRRLGNAVERASRSFLASCFRHVALVLALVALALAALHVYIGRASAGHGVRYITWSVLGLGVGALLTCVVGHVAVQLSHRASMHTLGALRVSLDRTLGVAVRTGGAVGLLAECVGVVGACLLFGLLQTLTSDDGVPPATTLAYALGGYALGSALAALVIQRAGTVYQSASEVGGELAGERDADLGAGDPRNPAAVAKLVGDHVGDVAARTVDLFVCGAVANTAVLLVGAHAFAAELSHGTLSLLLLPLVVKSFGVIASSFGIMVVRTEEAGDPLHGVWRGHATTLVICTGALLGTTLWLVGRQQWAPFFVAGALGLLVSALAAYIGARRVQRRQPPMRHLNEAVRLGDSGILAEGFVVGLGAALIPSVAAFVALIASWQLGRASELSGGGMLAVSLSLMTMLATGPFMLAINTFGPIADGARGIGAMAPLSSVDEALDRRTQRLSDAGIQADSFGQSFWTLVSGVAALFAASSLLVQGTPPDLASPQVLEMAHPAVAYSGLLGAALVLAYAAGVLKSATRSLKGVVVEVERQLRAFPKERGKFQIPRDYIPSYRACIQIVAHSAVGRPLIPVSIAVLLPIVLGPILLVATASPPATIRAALASFVLVGAVTGSMLAFASETVRACLSHLRRQLRAKSAGAESTLHAQGLAELCGATLGPAAQLVFKTAAVGSLAVAPFLS